MSRKTVALLLFSDIIQIMLEKFSKKLQNFYEGKAAAPELFDAHLHYAVCLKEGVCDLPEAWQGISCAHSRGEYETQKLAPAGVIQSYGMHPQNAANENIKESAAFLEEILKTKEISFIGEAGFDYFTDKFREASKLQEEIWNIQLELALKYNTPLVVHCRKANHKLFEYSKKLKQLSEVLFHSFMGPPVEARSLLNRGIKAYFSFGKQLLNNNKKAIACVRELPADCILPETDAPFQYLKGESYTAPSEIKKVIEAIKRIRSNT